MLVWRVSTRRHATRAFSGDGARLYGGRWNHRGAAVVYTSATLSLAALELLVNLDPDTMPNDLIAISATFPEDLAFETIDLRSLPHGWRRYPAPEALQDLGTAWLRTARTSVLSVPSAVVPRERNYLLNPAHPEFSKIRIGKAEPFHLDPRLWINRGKGRG